MDAQLQDLVQQWLRWDNDERSKKQVKDLMEKDPAKLRQIMTPRIAFGTAGLRAEMGPGFARMNSVTVTQASQGLAKYVNSLVMNATERGIVIGHDHRFNSKQFAEDVAKTFAYLGFKLHFLGEVHTPLVPFAVSRFRAACGVMITASHNPAKDNGYKVYWENACQIIPPHDDGIAEEIMSNLELWDAPLPDIVPIDILDDYFEAVIKPLTKNLETLPRYKFVYTPMHGVGMRPALRCFDLLGRREDMHIVREQALPDPSFPTVDFPNPEEKGALDLAMSQANKAGANVVLANDPDADRFTCAIRVDGHWKQLTGDQIGALFTDYILSHTPSSTSKIAVINSTVSSRQMLRQAKLAGVEFYETLTGFKWIGNKALDLESHGYIVPFAYEEAIGYMVGGHEIKDKDGISALYMFIQVLGEIFKRGTTVTAELDRISRATGYFATHNGYYIVASPSVTVQTFDKIRTLSKESIGNLKVTAWRDLTLGYDSSQPDNKPVLPVSKSSEMLTVEVQLPNGATARFTARGSGTEPKLKVYIEATASSEELAQKSAELVWDTLAVEWFKGL